MKSKKCKVIILKSSVNSILRQKKNGTMRLADSDELSDDESFVQMYIVSNDAGRLDDWCFELYDEYESDLVRYPSSFLGKSWYLRRMNMAWSENDPLCKRIVGTTHPELTKVWVRDNDPNRLNPDYIDITPVSGVALVPISFLQLFVDSYNNGKVIKKVKVKYHRSKDNSRKILRINPRYNTIIIKTTSGIILS